VADATGTAVWLWDQQERLEVNRVQHDAGLRFSTGTLFGTVKCECSRELAFWERAERDLRNCLPQLIGAGGDFTTKLLREALHSTQ
jgi:hypothetical protein